MKRAKEDAKKGIKTFRKGNKDDKYYETLAGSDKDGMVGIKYGDRKAKEEFEED